MARVLQIRRGTAAQNDKFTGLAGELSFDMDAKTLRVHDGQKLGGYALARADNMPGTGGTGGGDNNTGAAFDIESVPDEFWAALFERFGNNGGTETPVPEFDISTVPDEFWTALFAKFAPGDTGGGTLNMQESGGLPLQNDQGLEYTFDSLESALFAQAVLVCRTADAGYSAGDICTAFGIGDYCAPRINLSTTEKGLNAFVAIGGQAYWVAHKETGVRTNVTNNRWRVKIRVYY